MNGSIEHSVRRIMSGQARGAGPALLRGVLRLAEPIYAAAVAARNRRFDRGIGVRRLPRPVISVGNLTAGGTGKTPVVAWLCRRLRDAGMRPAVLMRGYKSAAGTKGDEQLLLERELNGEAGADAPPPVLVHADPDRFRGGNDVLRDQPNVDVFILDDGFQHRRLHRDFDMVLIDACNPFGYGHVHPRGLLREGLAGLRRAGAVLLTRSAEVDDAARGAIAAEVRRWNATAPLHASDHVHTGLQSAGGSHDLDAIAGKRYFAFCGIGNPESFGRQVGALPGEVAGHRWFADHHAYTERDLADLQQQARAAGAHMLLTTEKDWVKIAPLAARAEELEIWRLTLAVRFRDDGEEALLRAIRNRIANSARLRPLV